MRDDCLKEVLKRHREKVAAEILKNREKVLSEQREFSYPSSQCDLNGWVG